MADEKQKNNLESLGHRWSQRVKDIRQMAKKAGPDASGEALEAGQADGTPPPLPDSALFTKTAHQDLSVQQLFAGDEEFYKSMGSAASPSAHLPAKGVSSFRAREMLIGGVVAAALGVLLYGGWSVFNSRRVAILPSVTASPHAEEVAPPADSALPLPVEAAVAKQPVSLKAAQDFYRQADYTSAQAIYEQLLAALLESGQEDLLADFLRLKIALCLEKTADFQGCDTLFKAVSQSRSPIVRVVANYHLGRLEMQKRQYLAARTRAYQAIALVDAVDFEKKWSRQLRRNCYFLAAEAVSKEVLSLSEVDSDVNRELPSQLWTYLDDESNPLSGEDETALRGALRVGSELLAKALLAPQIQRDADGGTTPSWTVTCQGASIDELMGRFAAATGRDVHWNLNFEKIEIRNRAVSLYLPGANTPQLITVAAGAAGLLAALDENNVITVRNPAEYAYVSEQVAVLGAEAIACWQKFLLTFHEDPYLANAHFVLGLLKAQQGRVAEAVAEYKIVVNRFSRSPLAPAALFNSAQLRTGLQDYSGAYGDLRGIVEQYPDSDKVHQAYLLLAETAVKMGQDDDAVKLYSRLYNLNLSRSWQASSAFSAGKLYYEMGEFVSAEKWLTQYLGLEENTQSRDLYYGYFLLGKSRLAMGKFASAQEALRRALAGQLSQEDYREVISALVEGYIQQQAFVSAFELLDNASFPQFSEKDFIRILVLKSRVLRAMGLADKAIVILGDRQDFVTDGGLKTEIGYELSECYIEKEDFNSAYKKLSQTLQSAPAGEMAHQTAMKLAEVCLRLDKDVQAVSVCSQILSSQPSEPTRQKTLQLLAASYHQQKNYDRAALALLGQWQ